MTNGFGSHLYNSPHPALAPRPAELCQLFNAWQGSTPPEGIWAEQKIDGFRALWINGALVTREGIPIVGISHIVHRIRALQRAFGCPMFFDGEWQVGGTLDATRRHFMRRGGNGDAGTLYLFDAMPMVDWEAGGSDTPLVSRKRLLRHAFDTMSLDPLSWEWPEGSRGRVPPEAALVLVEEEWLLDAHHVARRAQEIWSAGGEGLVLKDAEAGYERKRARTWWKVKQ